MERCPYCFRKLPEYGVCECRYEESENARIEEALHPGAIVGACYQIGAVLGKGGFGITYKAFDLNMQKVVAIKEFYPDGLVTRGNLYSEKTGEKVSRSQVVTMSERSGETYRKSLELFYREAMALGKLEKFPNVVHAYHIFRENGTAYIVMQYVEGQSLKGMINEQGRIPEGELLPLLDPVLTALERVHEAGILHRDIAPDNIMIENGEPILLDFGAARVEDSHHSSLVIGKKGYSAPEQMSGNAVDRRSDIYSMGATYYKALSGITPQDAVKRALGDQVVPLKDMGLGISPAVSDAVMKAMAFKPGERWASAAEFQQALNGKSLPEGGTKDSGKAAGNPVKDATAGETTQAQRLSGGSSENKGSDGSSSKNSRKIEGKSQSEQKRTPKWLLPVILTAAAGIGIIVFFMQRPGGRQEKSAATVPVINKVESSGLSEQEMTMTAIAVFEGTATAAVIQTETQEVIDQKMTAIAADRATAEAIVHETETKQAEPTETPPPPTDTPTLTATPTATNTPGLSGQEMTLTAIAAYKETATAAVIQTETQRAIDHELTVIASDRATAAARAHETETKLAEPTETPLPPTSTDTLKPTAIPTKIKDPGFEIVDGKLRKYRGNKSVVTIPDNVTSIGSYAFDGCAWVTTVTIPNSVTSIGERAFSYCSNLTSVMIPDSVASIGNRAFYQCSSLTSVTIPDSVTSIGEDAFRGCSSLTYVTIPYSVISIGNRAFYNCRSLTSIAIPDSVTSIGNNAFYGCNRLTTVTIPNNVTTIGEWAFGGNTTLKVSRNSYAERWCKENMDSGNCITYDSNSAISTATKMPQPTSTSKPTVQPIEEMSPEEMYALAQFYTQMNDYANALIYYEKAAEQGYAEAQYSLGYIYETGHIVEQSYEKAMALYQKAADQGYVSAKMKLGELRRKIDSRLTATPKPTETKTPQPTNTSKPMVQPIEEMSPEEMYALAQFYIQMNDYANALIYYEKAAEQGYAEAQYSLGYIYETGRIVEQSYEKAMELYQKAASQGYASAKMKLGELRRKIDFESTSTLKPTAMPTKIEDPDFEIVSGELRKYRGNKSVVTIPDNVTSIGSYAFDGCNRLTTVTIPNSVTSIGERAFSYCSNLTSVMIPDSVASIGNRAFYQCSSLTSVTIPDSVTSIGEDAFRGCSSLTYVTIPYSVISIGNRAFYNCRSLTSIAIPDSVTSIGNNAFYGCNRLTTVTIPNNVTTIGEWAFGGNTTLKVSRNSYAERWCKENMDSGNCMIY